MRIGPLDTADKVLIIAEIGNNHEGDFHRAVEMIHAAAEAGADAVKFQTIVPEKLVSALQTERIRQLKRFQLSRREFERLAEVARGKGVLFLSTPFDIESARFLEPLVPAYKIASGDNTFYPLIRAVAAMGKPIILSTGAAAMEEIRRTRDFIRNVWRERGIEQHVALLHCVVSYPTPSEEANLLAIGQLKQLGEVVGYSDHTLGIEAAVLSVALGARIIEKHFTLDKNHSDFRDHALSADPADLKSLVARVGEAIKIFGNGEKRVMDAEKGTLEAVRRSMAASRDLGKGAVVAEEDIVWVRPGGGLAPGNEDAVLGKVLKRPVRQGEMLLAEYVE